MLNKLKNLEKDFTVTKAALIVGIFTLLGKFVAFAREFIFSAVFGQNRTLDTYFASFRIPDFVTNLFVMSTLSVAFLPIFTQILTKDKEEANKFANNVFNVLMIGIGILCLILLMFLEPLTRKLVPGFSPEDLANTLNLTRLFLLSPLIFTAATLFGGILNAQKKFLVASIAPIFYNLGIIFGVLYLYPHFGIMGLGYGVIAGAVVQLLIQLWACLLLGYRWFPVFNIYDSDFWKLTKLYVPRIFAFDLANVTLLLGTVVGSKLIEGSISALNQAYNLQSVPVGVFAYALAVASFPALSEFYALREEGRFIATLSKTIKQLMFFIVPISVLVLLLRAYIVRLVLGHGNFTWQDTIMTFSVLGIFSFSLFSQSLTTLLSRAFYARHNTKTPVLINIASILVNIGMTYVLGYRFGVQGITAAFVISSVSNALLLFAVLRHNLLEQAETEVREFDRDLFASISKILLGSILMGLFVYGSIYLVARFVNTDTTIGILIQSGSATVVGTVVYLTVGKFFKLKEAQYMLDMAGKLWYSNR